MPSNQLVIAAQQLASVFDFQPPADDENFSTDFPQKLLEDVLASRILYFIEFDFQTLLAKLYRIDVAEDKVKTALNAESLEEASQLLAKMIIERQLQKLKYREMFSKNNFNNR